MLWAILIVIAVLFVAGVSSGNKIRKILAEKIKEIPNFSVTDEWYGPGYTSGIIFDSNTNRVCFLEGQTTISTINPGDFKFTCFEGSAILGVELVEDGNSISESSTGSMVGRALVGGVLTGGLGMLVGAATGSKTQKNLVKNVDLRVTVLDTSKPVRTVNFFHSFKSDGAERTAISYKTASEKARHWEALLTVVIKISALNDRKAI